MQIVLGCCLIHLCIGSIYASSVLYAPIILATGWNNYIPVVGFSLTILVLGITASLFRRLCSGEPLSKLIFSSIMVYMSTQLTQLVAISTGASWLYLLTSALMGIPIGVMYQTTVSEVTKFDKHVGLYSGLVVSSFGIGSLIASNVYGSILAGGITNLLMYMIPAYTVMLIGQQLLRKSDTHIYKEGTQSDIISSSSWKLLYIIFFFNITVGIGLLSNLVSFSLEIGGLTLTDAVFLVGVAGLSNGIGRLVLATLSDYLGKFLAMPDYLGRLLVLQAALSVQWFCAVFLSKFWIPGVILILAVYGGGFALMPGICKEVFKERGVNAYGLLLSAWGFAGIAGTLISNIFGIWGIAVCATIALAAMFRFQMTRRIG